MKSTSIIAAALLALGATAWAQSGSGDGSTLRTYVIERDLPGVGNLSNADLKAIARKSNGVLTGMGSRIQWVESYVTGDKIFCVYRAESAEAIRQHAAAGGFPADRVSLVASKIDPTTAR